MPAEDYFEILNVIQSKADAMAAIAAKNKKP